MRILITNDDGINAQGLLPLVQWAQHLGEVTVIAPKEEQSGKSHGIEIHKAFEMKKVDFAPGIEAYALDSTPADCVRVAILGMKKQFDLVISGINRGLNIGQDTIYSGTVGAIFEANALGVPALAFSTSPAYYDKAVAHMDEIYDYICRNRLLEKSNLYNINIPEDPVGFRITRQGGPYYSDEFEFQENDMVMPCGIDVFRSSETKDLDTDAVLVHHLISVSPLTLDRTNHAALAQLQYLNQE
jgi:5'-nucleotidase